MKIEIQKPDRPNELQQLVSRLPFDPESESEFQGLMFVEQLLNLMKEKGINRTQLARKMGVGPSRVTAMLNGTSNFKMETLVRAADAVGASISTALVPKGAKARWQIYREDEVDTAFRTDPKTEVLAGFTLETDEIADDDDADAA